MSALDQAFIKAYAKEALAPPTGAVRSAAAAQSASAPPAPLDPPHIDSLYAEGALYRLELPQVAGPAPAVPAPHYEPRPARRLANPRRSRGYSAIHDDTLDTAEAPTVPPARRTTAASLRQIARRLAQFLPSDRAAEAPEMIVVEPEADDVVPIAVAPAALPPASPSAPSQASAASVSVPISEPATTLPAIEDTASLVEVCTPWEPIEVREPASMLVLPLAGDLSSPPRALVDVYLDPFLDHPTQTQAVAHTTAQQVPPSRPAAPDAAADQEVANRLPDTPAPRTLRIDPPEPTAARAPHFDPVERIPPVSEEPSFPGTTAPWRQRAELTPEETESLLGASPVAEQPPAPVPAVAAPAAVEPLVPMWEVDRFQWPAICEGLLADERSYFSQAGAKLVAAAKDGLRTLGITGSRRGEGRTTLALCLARCAAQAGLSVALIDADFTRPQLASVIGLEVAYGWQDAAQGKIPLAEAAVKSLSDKITVLPLEASSVAWPLSLADRRVGETIRAVAASYDLVLVDLGPIPAGSDPIFPPDEPSPLDAVIVLRDLRYATLAETHAIGERLQASGIEAVGIAENFVPPEQLQAR
jgi:Mrp family chromosome partitioning ATPase